MKFGVTLANVYLMLLNIKVYGFPVLSKTSQDSKMEQYYGQYNGAGQGNIKRLKVQLPVDEWYKLINRFKPEHLRRMDQNRYGFIGEPEELPISIQQEISKKQMFEGGFNKNDGILSDSLKKTARSQRGKKKEATNSKLKKSKESNIGLEIEIFAHPTNNLDSSIWSTTTASSFSSPSTFSSFITSSSPSSTSDSTFSTIRLSSSPSTFSSTSSSSSFSSWIPVTSSSILTPSSMSSTISSSTTYTGTSSSSFQTQSDLTTSHATSILSSSIHLTSTSLILSSLFSSKPSRSVTESFSVSSTSSSSTSHPSTSSISSQPKLHVLHLHL